MPNDEILTDEYVAGLLAKDAQDCSLKFSTMGMDAYRSNKKPANLPKPNTRFLRNIIKDTNSHNSALLAKEAAESQARLERLEKAEGRRNAKPGDIRKRQIGSINAILGNKPSRGSAGEASSHAGGSRRDARVDSRRRSRSPEEGRERVRRRDRRDEERGRHRSEGPVPHTRKRQKRDSNPRDDHHRSRRGSSHGRSRSPSNRESRRRERSTSRRRHPRSTRDSDRRRDQRKENQKATNADSQNNSASDSDPLDDFIGPAPPPKSPVRTRGRGTISAFSGIDRRFAADYDPKLDVDEAAPEADDWSEAVEAFRDRQKLRAAQEERMRAAGFSEEAMGRLRDSGREKTEADVKWAKAGEKREWDIGKELGAD